MNMLPSLLALVGQLVGQPRSEAPRPDLERPERWASLNGQWDFCFDPDGTGTARALMAPGAAGYDRTITVPYPWESALSGVQVTDYRGVAWYRRSFTVPPSWPPGQRVYLCFGAVDWLARVWVNGTEVGAHEGGYTPFRLDVTDALAPGENTIVVRVRDDTDPHLPVGKQVHWYTTTSGIWQPVWLESVPPTHVTDLAVSADLDPPVAHLAIGVHSPTAGAATIALAARDGAIPAVSRTVELRAGRTEVSIDWPIPDGRPWSPEEPRLYDYTVTVERDGATDRVDSYLGLRTIATGKVAGQEYSSILLNGRPVYLRGALHQVFNPEGIYTFPDDAAIRRDLEIARQLGWNYLRLHIKIVDPRFIYWADRLGVMLMCDMPNTWQYSARARDAWEQTMREAVRRDRSHPSIIAWCCFNESWGIGGGELKQNSEIQRWVAGMTALTKQLDPSRLVEDNSPCLYDHVAGDINSWHFYIDNYEAARDHIRQVVDQTYPGSGFNFCPGYTQGEQPLMNSEYGGVSAGGGDRDVAWCFKYLTTLLRAEGKCQGYVYTEHCDIEWEHNGLVCYDRTPKVFGYDAFVPEMTVADLQGADFIGYDGPPCLTVTPGGEFELTPFVSHYSALAGPATLRWTVHGWDTLARPVEGATGEAAVEWSPAAVSRLAPLTVPVPATLAIGAVGLELFVDGRRVAANYANLLAEGERLPAAEALGPREVALRFRPGAIAAAEAPETPNLLATLEADKLAATGRPRFTWRLRVPAALRGARFERLTLLLEAGARGGDAKLDWPQRRNPLDYPQTKLGRATPSVMAATLDGVPLGTVPLPDDHADARGVLSHLAYRDHGSHGVRVELTLDLTAHPELAAKLGAGEPVDLVLAVPADAADAHGLAIYGERMGRWVLPPTLLLRSLTDLPVPPGWTSRDPVTAEELLARRETVVPTAETNGATWRYTTTAPAPDWTQPNYDDSPWREGRGGFGTAGTPNAIVGTRWDSPDIWLRHRFTLRDALGDMDVAILRLYHDEDAEIYVNGTKVLERHRFVTSYVEEVLSREAVALLRAGENVLAVHCRQTVGGQNIDVGLAVLRAR